MADSKSRKMMKEVIDMIKKQIYVQPTEAGEKPRQFEDTGTEARQAIEQKKKDLEAAGKMDSYKKGGKVRKTGPAKMHKGEVVLTTGTVKKMKKMMKNDGCK